MIESGNFGNLLFADIDNNEYLNELYESILHNYSLRLFNIEKYDMREINIEDALRFADILSNSTDLEKSDQHKIWAQEIIAILHELYPDNKNVSYYIGTVLSNTGNYYGMSKIVPEFENLSLYDRVFTNFSKKQMSVPAEPEKQFLSSQKRVYDRLDEQYLSYSAPTSMGKSFIMRMFIKEQIQNGSKQNFAILVPTKALINEVSSKIINDLKEMLTQYNYRVVTAAGALVLKQPHKFIFVLTPERLLYLLIGNPDMKINYLFIDEAHKISSRDSRSAFYYKVVDMLARQTPMPHVIFASPNIPNPEIYLKLLPDVEEINHYKIATEFSPVSQVKYFVDLVEGTIQIFNSHSGSFSYVGRIDKLSLGNLINKLNHKESSQDIIYCSSTSQAIDNALEFAKDMPELHIPELDTLSKDIKNEVHGDYYLAELIKQGVSYHIGYLPATIRMRIEELFAKGLIRTIFCTSTLVEGVNLPADNLFITNYKNGSSPMKAVDFKNLIGRVGRIDFGLYGNVFLVRMFDSVKKDEFENMLKETVPEQKLSLVTELTGPQKKLVIECLEKGQIELLRHPKKQSEDNYSLMRKFALILLQDIEKNRDSAVKKEFAEFLTTEKEEIIRQAFNNSINKPDDDINMSVDQTDNIYMAIRGGLVYPRIDERGNVDYQELTWFLERLCNIFKWEKYERSSLGKVSKSGEHSMLKWYAVILVQWIQGTGLSNIMNKAIEYKETHPESSVMDKGKFEKYDKSVRHENIVIADTLKVIENVILFSISNYFLRFSDEYKKIHNVDSFKNDWYEYVEYGTTNSLTIMLQRSGFSREASTYIKKHRDDYIITIQNEPYIRRALLECDNASVRKEAADIKYNVPELFV